MLHVASFCLIYLFNHIVSSTSVCPLLVQPKVSPTESRNAAALRVLQIDYAKSIRSNITQALNSYYAAYKALESREKLLVQAARELQSQTWFNTNDLTILIEKGQSLLSSTFPYNPRPQMEVFYIDKSKVADAVKLAPGDQRNLICPSDCDSRYCSKGMAAVTQCYRPQSSSERARVEVFSDIDVGVECVPFENPDLQTCPSGYIRCSEGHPRLDHHIKVHETDGEAEAVVLRGINLSLCSRLLILPQNTNCGAKSATDYTNLMALSEKATGAMGGHVIRPMLSRGANFETLAIFSPRVQMGLYTLCYVEFQPGMTIQTADERRQALKESKSAEFQTLVLKVMNVGELTVLGKRGFHTNLPEVVAEDIGTGRNRK